MSNRNVLNSGSAKNVAKGHRIRKPADLVIQARKEKAADFLASLTLQRAGDIIEADSRIREGDDRLKLETKANYAKTCAHRLEHYREVLQLPDVGALSPFVAANMLCEQSRMTSRATLVQYWSAVLSCFRSQRVMYVEKGWNHAEHDRAIAALIVISTPPYKDERPPSKDNCRRDGISAGDSALLFKYLEKSEVNRAPEAGVLARAILLTGVSPGEWGEVEWRTSTSDGLALAFPTIFVPTSKTKTGDEPRWRSLELPSRDAQSAVWHNIENVRAEIEGTSLRSDKAAIENFTKKCSQRILDASKALWPMDPTRRFTLYHFRQQARANFARHFGEATAAAMLGHGYEVGRKHYSAKRKGTRGLPAVTPGLDVRIVAAAMAQQHAKRVDPSTFRTQQVVETEEEEEHTAERPR